MARDDISAALQHLKPKQVVAIHALETERSITAAARKAGVGLRTLHRWMREPLFAEVVRCLRVRLYQEARHARLALAGTAIDQLSKMLEDPGTPPGVRARLIQIALEQADRMSEMMKALGQSTDPSLDAPDDYFLLIANAGEMMEELRALKQQGAALSASRGQSATPDVRRGDRTAGWRRAS